MRYVKISEADMKHDNPKIYNLILKKRKRYHYNESTESYSGGTGSPMAWEQAVSRKENISIFLFDFHIKSKRNYLTEMCVVAD